MSISGQSLGLIETIGLATAIEAADAAIKSANVELLGYEPAKGNGMHTVKLVGDVGAVKAAVDAGVAAASRIGEVYAYKVLARTAEGLESVITASENVGTQVQEVEPVQTEQDVAVKDKPAAEPKEVKPSSPQNASKVGGGDKSVPETPAPKAEPSTAKKVTKSTTPATNKAATTSSRTKSGTSRRTASN